jgi:hypothetical protein
MSPTDPCTGKALERLERVRYVSGLVLGLMSFGRSKIISARGCDGTTCCCTAGGLFVGLA